MNHKQLNLITIPNLSLIIAPIFYFYMSWFFPWDIINVKSTISISYLFDIFFAATIFLSLKKKPKIGYFKKNSSIFMSLSTIILGIICVSLTKQIGFKAPFKYIDYLFVQILILAPIIEELVFRGAFMELAENAKLSSRVSLTFNALLFSFSHASALWHLPNEFKNFIWFQILYTLILGFICARSRLSSGGILKPILLHFGFNLVFYVAIKYYSL